MLFVANRTHSICPRIPIKATSCATQHRPRSLVSLLSHIFLLAGGPNAAAGLARDAGAGRPGRGRREREPSGLLWSRRRRRPRAGWSRRRRWRRRRRRGILLCSCSSAERGRDTPELGKWEEEEEEEEGGEGGPRRRRREDHRPRRRSLLTALACRRLTPPGETGRADEGGERSEGRAPRGPADGAACRSPPPPARLRGCRQRASPRTPCTQLCGPADGLALSARRPGGEGERGRGLCVSANPGGGGGERADVASPRPGPGPAASSPGHREAGRAARTLSEPSHRPGGRPLGGAGRSQACGGCVSIFNPIVLPQPPSFRFSHSSPLFAVGVLTLLSWFPVRRFPPPPEALVRRIRFQKRNCLVEIGRAHV